MTTVQKLACQFSIESLRERQTGISLAIDKAKGRQLAGLRRRYWLIEQAIEMKRAIP